MIRLSSGAQVEQCVAKATFYAGDGGDGGMSDRPVTADACRWEVFDAAFQAKTAATVITRPATAAAAARSVGSTE